MKHNLLQPISQRRALRTSRPGSRLRRGVRRRAEATAVATVTPGRGGEPDSAHHQGEPDTPLSRGRSAGGPEDLASYTCSCGYFFSAPVSTTVSCPHCGAGQAW